MLKSKIENGVYLGKIICDKCGRWAPEDHINLCSDNARKLGYILFNLNFRPRDFCSDCSKKYTLKELVG